jgi:hypothetical protein
MNQRKGGRKRQPQPPSLQAGSFAKIAHRAISLRSALPATQGLIGATKQAEVRAFSGLPARLKKMSWSFDQKGFLSQNSLRKMQIQKNLNLYCVLAPPWGGWGVKGGLDAKPVYRAPVAASRLPLPFRLSYIQSIVRKRHH